MDNQPPPVYTPLARGDERSVPINQDIQDGGAEVGEGTPLLSSSGSSRAINESEEDGLRNVQHPECTIDTNGNVLTLDPSLSQNPDSLLSFLKLHATCFPTINLRVHGTHDEIRHETSWERDHNGRHRRKDRDVTHTVTDFDFNIPILTSSSYDVQHQITIPYVVPSDVPAYRLGMSSSVGRRAQQTHSLQEDHTETDPLGWFDDRETHERDREIRGLPGFLPVDCIFQKDLPPNFYKGLYVHAQEMTSDLKIENEEKIKRWIESFVRSDAMYKEWKTQKRIVGLDFKYLESLIRNSVSEACRMYLDGRENSNNSIINFNSSNHSSLDLLSGRNRRINLTWSRGSDQVIVRNPSPLSQFFSLHWFWKFLLWISLVYPLVWLATWIHYGRKVDTVRIDYLVQYWRQIPSSETVKSLQQADALLESLEGKSTPVNTRQRVEPPAYRSSGSAEAQYYNVNPVPTFNQNEVKRREIVCPQIMEQDDRFPKGWYVKEGETEEEIFEAFKWSIVDGVRLKVCDSRQLRRT